MLRRELVSKLADNINRYRVASSLYLKEHEPQQNADIVVNNNDISSPYLSFLKPLMK